jgi:hypothetical protein
LRLQPGAESLEVLGYAGVLGEWELTASVTGNDDTSAYSGPLTMTHVGICTVDGPEEKKGEIRFRLSGSSSRIQATLLVDGIKCSYSAPIIGLFFRNHELPKPTSGAIEAVGEIVAVPAASLFSPHLA